MVKIVCKGDYKKAQRYFTKLREAAQIKVLEKYGQKGVDELRKATPKRSGKTADSWTYSVERKDGSATITWENTNVNKGVNIAVIIQYGHGTGTGGYVKGIDYINPAITPIFEQLADEAWREVTQL